MGEKKAIRTLIDDTRHTSFCDTIYRNLIENAGDGIAILQDMLIKYANPTLISMLGYTQEEVLETSYTKYLMPESLEQIASYYQGLDRQSSPNIYEASIRHKEGYGIPVEINSSTIWFNGRSADFIIFRSLDERRSKQKIAMRMQQLQKLECLGLLAGGISHDFNNLLQGILGNADLAMMYETDPDLVHICLRDIKSAASKASELALMMRAYSGRVSSDIQDTDINQLITETTELLELAIPTNCRLHASLPNRLPLIRADHSQLTQVVINLINNAIEAIGGDQGMITISAECCHCDRSLLSETYLDEKLPEGEYIRIGIHDTGEGIEENVRDKIFDPFFSTKFTGRGLGLAAVLGIIRAHCGAIGVESTPTSGTLFSIYLPVSVQSCVQTAISSIPEPDETSCGTVLVVDDESTVRTTTTRILERFDFSVIVVPDGETALEVYKKAPRQIDIVLLDMMMPKINGIETFSKLRDLDENVRVILMSGYQESEIRDRLKTAPPFGFLQKPFTARKLLSQIRQILDL
jgi:two-component system, cell cycle sensor histidine kinase and response regulator CckA